MYPTKSGYADMKGVKLYHEIYGEGEPDPWRVDHDRRDAGMG
jgi:hypothetical protein